MTIEEAKIQYNKLLKRFHKANDFFDSTDRTKEEKEQFLPQFTEVLSGLSFLLGQIEVYTKQEAMEGFK